MEAGGELKDEKLPPGFRFHPTDEELITYYLINKISDASFTGRAVGDVDLNKCEPWDLPGKAKMGEKEWYFFNLRDRKYPTGVRTNRATNTGYWKTTGKDKEIFNSNTSEIVGMKKTLVFYRGRAPRGEKTNWVMHEYRIHSKSVYRTAKDEWVVCRVFQKSGGGKKNPTSSISSNYSRAVNHYSNYNINLDHHHQNHMQSQLMKQQQENNIPIFPGRNYISQADIQEYNKMVLRGNMVNFPIPTQLNYGGTPAAGPGCFTISGLNLNLGGTSTSTSQPPVMNQPVLMNATDIQGDQVHGYNGEMSNATNTINNSRFMGMDQCGDLDTYWPSY